MRTQQFPMTRQPVRRVGMFTASRLIGLRISLLTLLIIAAISLDGVAQEIASEGASQAETTQGGSSALGAGPISAASGAYIPQLGPGEQAILGSGVRPKESNGERHYNILRYDEDYSYLRDSSRQNDFWDPIKYVPLAGDFDCYMSMGGELRERFETFHDPGFGAPPENSQGYNDYFTQRYMLNADLRVDQHLRFFTQTVSGFEDGAIGGPRPQIDSNEFGFHQAFVDIVQTTGDAEGSDSITWRLGRQEMFYGSGRLIDVREGVNLRLSFDAARFLAHKDDWAIDGFWARPVLNEPNVFDDIPDPRVSLWGLYAVHPLVLLPDGHVDLYYLGYTNERAQYNQGVGYELRHTLGTRLWGAPLPFEYNVECIYQFGSFGDGSIQAWSIASAVRYNFSEMAWKPRFGLRVDVASGDRNPNSPNLQSFNPLFPSGVYYNLANPVGPINLIDLHPTLDLSLTEKLTFTADWNFFWRESIGDGIYTLGGQLLRPSGNDLSRYVGSTPSLTMVWAASRHLTLLTSYAHVFPGPFVRDSPPNLPTDYFTTWLTYKF